MEPEEDYDQITHQHGSDDDDDSENEGVRDKSRRRKPPRPSTAAARKSMAILASSASNRHRRRSSARFLHLNNGREDSNDFSDNSNSNTSVEQNLSELYEKAIRLNAENKINAGNSWNLRLIENIDNFLEQVVEEDSECVEDDETCDPLSSLPQNVGSGDNKKTTKNIPNKRVNFTKASCTLDASVKIYSYRVDDVHLSSYKVLANLNRSDTNKEKPKKAEHHVDDDDDENKETDTSKQRTKKPTSAGRSSGTLETNLANINMNKLDSRFDVDPLFHKMSKAFDEGGAKGLLLHNLGVGPNGCNIVFDSSESNDYEESKDISTADKMILDIAAWTRKVEELFESDSDENLQLVPQLQSLRQQYYALEAEGFIDNDQTPSHQRRNKKKFYEPDAAEEKEAVRTIQKIAMERQCRYSMTPARSRQGARIVMDDDSESPFDKTKGVQLAFDLADNDFADKDDDDYDGYHMNNESFPTHTEAEDLTDIAATNQTSSLLDALSNGTLRFETNANSTNYFDASLFKDSTNAWAGVSHWQRADTRDFTTTKKVHEKLKVSRIAKKRVIEPYQHVRLNITTPDLSIILESGNVGKKAKGVKNPSRNASIQLSKSIITKYANNENMLPDDSNYYMDDLFRLFLRSDAIFEDKTTGRSLPKDTNVPHKQVGFMDEEISFSNDDTEGQAFCFAAHDDDFASKEQLLDNSDEYIVKELDDIRKIEKIEIGYATVAKKVDVKRLKQDLWTELEQKILICPASEYNKDELDEDEGQANDVEIKNTVLSFQDTVRDMEMQKSQQDVSLAFYFICILHLANEKCLSLISSETLTDFSIQMDQ